MPKFGNLRTHHALGAGQADLVSLDYQTVGEWLKHVETKHGKVTADKCRDQIWQLGISERSQVWNLPINSNRILDEAQRTP